MPADDVADEPALGLASQSEAPGDEEELLIAATVAEVHKADAAWVEDTAHLVEDGDEAAQVALATACWFKEFKQIGGDFLFTEPAVQ